LSFEGLVGASLAKTGRNPYQPVEKPAAHRDGSPYHHKIFAFQVGRGVRVSGTLCRNAATHVLAEPFPDSISLFQQAPRAKLSIALPGENGLCSAVNPALVRRRRQKNQLFSGKSTASLL